jgi:hypothetical protein
MTDRSGLGARRERPRSLRAQSRLGCRCCCRFRRGRGGRGGGGLLRRSLLRSRLLRSGLLCRLGGLLGSSLFRCGLLRCRLLGSGLLRSSLLRRRLLRCGLLGRSLLRCSLLRCRTLCRGLLRRSLLRCGLLGRSLLRSGLLRGRFLCRSLLRSCHYILLDQVAKAPADSGNALTDRLFTARRSGRCRYGSSRPDTVNQVASRACRFCVGTSRSANLDLSLWPSALPHPAHQSQDSAPPDWYSMTRVSKKLRSFFRSIISLIHGNGFSSFGKSSSKPICVARRLAM